MLIEPEVSLTTYATKLLQKKYKKEIVKICTAAAWVVKKKEIDKERAKKLQLLIHKHA